MIHWFANVGDTQPHVDAYIKHTCDMQMEASLKQPRHIYIYITIIIIIIVVIYYYFILYHWPRALALYETLITLPHLPPLSRF